MDEYLKIFIDEEYPSFLDKYLDTDTLNRIKYVTQFCGCDYTKLYNPLFLYTRYMHSLVVAHITWHFTHDKTQTIASLLHDVGTPCFAHCIDYVLGDYINQETSEKNITEIIKKDSKLCSYLKSDNISLDDLNNLSKYTILENKSPKLCADRLDGVLGTCYIWLCSNTLEDIKEVYDDILVLTNENGEAEIGFNNLEISDKFSSMVYNYSIELRNNKDKFVMQYISDIIKLSIKNGLFKIDDLYIMKENDIVNILESYYSSWNYFKNATDIIRSDIIPDEYFIESYNTKNRNVIPLVRTIYGNKRIDLISNYASRLYDEISKYRDSKYAYVKSLKIN